MTLMWSNHDEHFYGSCMHVLCRILILYITIIRIAIYYVCRLISEFNFHYSCLHVYNMHNYRTLLVSAMCTS